MALNPVFIQRPAAAAKAAENKFYWAVALIFPLLVFAGYAKTYYLGRFFGAAPMANQLVHFHGIVMSIWVLYFTSQIVLARTKNLKLHMTMGWVGLALAAVVVGVGLATAYDSHVVRHTAPPGIDPYSFLVIPFGDMIYFVACLGAAIYYRKRPAEHKALMFMTAINFAAPALARLPVVPPQYFLLWAFGFPCLIAVLALAWDTWRRGRLNKAFAIAVVVLCIAQPTRIALGTSQMWIDWMTAIFGQPRG